VSPSFPQKKSATVYLLFSDEDWEYRGLSEITNKTAHIKKKNKIDSFYRAFQVNGGSNSGTT
jgi:hypothetical protein